MAARNYIWATSSEASALLATSNTPIWGPGHTKQFISAERAFGRIRFGFESMVGLTSGS